MNVIPVVDLMGGKAVLARGGIRAEYRPLSTPLCHNPDPFATVAALLSVHPFPTLYVADLDAIEGRGTHEAVLTTLLRRYPSLNLWLDAGRATLTLTNRIGGGGRLRPVLGSETLADAATLANHPGALLSLDYRDGVLLGPQGLDAQPERWPPEVILMSLTHVGNAAGPDLALFQTLRDGAPRNAFYAAGGVRDAADLEHLAQAGAAGALVATALHTRRLDAAALRRVTVQRPGIHDPGARFPA